MRPTYYNEHCSLYWGDTMRVLPTLKSESIGFVLTDPPYGVDYQSNRKPSHRRLDKIANDTGPFIWWLWDVPRLLVDGGGLLCFCRWDVQDAFRQAIEWSGLTVRGQVIWDKVATGMGDLNGAPIPMHEVMWYATKGKRELPSKRPPSIVKATRLQGQDLVHPNEKPALLMNQLVRQYTAADELVLDPFAGSGSTLVACIKAGRPCLGIELDEQHCQRTWRRVDAATRSTGFSVE